MLEMIIGVAMIIAVGFAMLIASETIDSYMEHDNVRLEA